MDTIDPMVVRSPLGWEPPRVPPRRAWAAPLALLAVLVVVVLVGLLLELPYYAIAPGSAKEVDGLIRADGAETFPADGDVMMATVSLYRVRPFDALLGWLRSDVDIVPERTVLPPEVSDREYRRYNFEVMGESKQTAVVVALRRLGHEVTEHGEGAVIEQVLPEFPAQGRLRQGEVIKAVDGRPVLLVRDATEAIRLHQPGDLVTIDVAQPDGSEPRRIQVPVAPDPEQDGRPVLGVILRTFKRTFDLPFEVEIDSADIGGPSAGLAFTLGVIEALTPGELTGGNRVAATGTIDMDGTVGDVGGVAQKTSAVRTAGATVFLVPAAEYEIARAHAGPGLKVVKVATLQEALDALGSLGGDLTALGSVAPAPRG